MDLEREGVIARVSREREIEREGEREFADGKKRRPQSFVELAFPNKKKCNKKTLPYSSYLD